MVTIDFKSQLQARKLQAMKTDLPKQLSNLGQNFFSRAFQNGKWEQVPWRPRKKETKKSKGKHILVASGRLRAAVFHSRRKANFNEIVWGVDVPYAKVHNEGYDGEVRQHTRKNTITKRVTGGYKGVSGSGRIRNKGGGKVRIHSGMSIVKAHHMKMPKRQFMGDSPELRKLVKAKIQAEFRQVFQR